MKLSFLFLAVLFVACDHNSVALSADDAQAAATDRLTAEAQRQVGMPNIVNFTERKFTKMIMELRDSEMTTYTYIVDMHGKRHFLCESVGYGIPYSVQFTNPNKIVNQWLGVKHGYHSFSMPQPDPNGLFMPTSSTATWVLAATKNGPKPIYVESQILVSPFKLEE